MSSMMRHDITVRRRAIYTGLKPFISEEELLNALAHWEAHYATAPRFTLQRFVSELCREGELRQRRADILLSLVQAMNMPVKSLLADPLPDRESLPSTSVSETAAFETLMNALIDGGNKTKRFSLRLDLLASLDTRKMPVQFCHAMQRWLGDKAPLNVTGVSTELLRAMVNRAYVIMCERQGPVLADKTLAAAVSQVVAERPELERVIKKLL